MGKLKDSAIPVLAQTIKGASTVSLKINSSRRKPRRAAHKSIDTRKVLEQVGEEDEHAKNAYHGQLERLGIKKSIDGGKKEEYKSRNYIESEPYKEMNVQLSVSKDIQDHIVAQNKHFEKEKSKNKSGNYNSFSNMPAALIE
jgi:hypothetical protein